MQPTNWPIIFGRSGFPKFILLVTASGFAPVAIIFLQASATACAPPVSGPARQYLGVQSTVIANALLVPETRITAASPPGLTTVLFITK